MTTRIATACHGRVRVASGEDRCQTSTRIFPGSVVDKNLPQNPERGIGKTASSWRPTIDLTYESDPSSQSVSTTSPTCSAATAPPAAVGACTSSPPAPSTPLGGKGVATGRASRRWPGRATRRSACSPTATEHRSVGAQWDLDRAYERTLGPRVRILAGRDRAEDDTVWLVPCFFVRVGERGHGVTRALLDAAVELASRHGAPAIEGFPRSAGQPPSPDDYLGREETFAESGFRCIARPTPRRAVMRRDLVG